MRWTIRTAAASLALAAVVVLGPAPMALAAGPLPPPVDPIPALPSTGMKTWHTSAGGIGNQMMKLGEWWAMQVAAGKVAPGTVPVGATPPGAAISTGTPITAPSSLGLAQKLKMGAGAAGVGFLAIGVTGGTVSFVGQMTGADLDGAMCGQEQWLQTAYGVLTSGMGPSCRAPFIEPNTDATGSTTFSYGVSTLTFLGYVTYSSGQLTRYACYSGNWGSLQAGHRLYVQQGPGSGGWAQVASPGPPNTASLCGQSFSGVTRVGYAGQSATGYGTGFFEVREIATGTVVATTKATSADPLRNSKCTLTWPDGSKTEGFVGQYRQSEGFPIGAVDAACTDALVSKPGHGPGLLPSKIDITETREDTGATTEIATQDVPDFTESERKGLTPGNGKGLVLSKVVNGIVDSCMTWAADCAGWWSQSQNGTVSDIYRCTYGGADVALAECGPYRYTFDTKTQNPTITDPQTGNPVQWSSSPRGNNSTSPGGAGDVGPGQQCMDEWSSAPNPIEWVFHPIKCALVWAFVPRASVTDNFRDGIGSAWNNSTVGAMAVSLSGLPAIFSTEAGCAGLPFDIDFFGIHFQGRLFEACSEPWAGVATVVRNIISGVILVGGFLAILRYGAGVFGFVGLGLGVGDHDTHETKGVRFK